MTAAVRIDCPDWCISDHADYGARELARGDVIRHEGTTDDKAAGFTVQFGDDDPQPFAWRRVRLVTPAGKVLEDGYEFGDMTLSREQALDFGEKLLEVLQEV